MQRAKIPTAIIPAMLPKVILLDADGTLWRGSQVIGDAPEFIQRCQAAGVHCLLLSNNAGPDRQAYLAKCRKLGLDFRLEDIFSVNHLAGPWLKKSYPGAKTLVIGSPLLVRSIQNTVAAVCADDWLRQQGAADKPVTPDDMKLLCAADFDVVLVGIDANVSYIKLALASVAVQKGAKLVGANPDYSFPFEGGFELPGNGSIVQLIASVAGVEPVYLGKPSLHLLEQIEEETGSDRSDMLVIGDRVETDIAFAVKAGIPAILVLTGVETHPNSVAGMANVICLPTLSEIAQHLEI